jgi:Fur family ferric uptake transcriptional regulator
MFISAENLLKDSGLRITPGRLRILKLLQEAPKPLSTRDLQDQLDFLNLDQATIYRILKVLKQHGLVQNVMVGHKHQHWEPADHHHHLVCKNCSKVVSLPECGLKHLETQISDTHHFQNLTHSLEFFGLCPDCKPV